MKHLLKYYKSKDFQQLPGGMKVIMAIAAPFAVICGYGSGFAKGFGKVVREVTKRAH